MMKGAKITTRPERLTYSAAGVDTFAEEAGLKALLRWVNKTLEFRKGLGEAKANIGYFANVIDIGHGLGLAITTDGVGSKIIIAQMMGKYDTLGIDCVAMNVNDVICVGAEPLALVDCLSIEEPNAELLEQIGKGLYEGAKQANISIVGGEIAQVKDLIKGYKPGMGFELTGTCIGIVPLDKMNLGDSIREGDALIGFRSSGVHSNGLTLARKALLDVGKYSVHDLLPELDRPLGDELLEPTRIYAQEALTLLRSGVRVKALANITSDGLLNLTRVLADVGYVIEQLPPPQPIFDVIQRAGNISYEEMFRVFNMGIGFCVVVDSADVDTTLETVRSCGTEAHYLGYAVEDPLRQVQIKQYDLLGRENEFKKVKRMA
jgi:phosphoribosylformylglycinamidine cyclo-ligase